MVNKRQKNRTTPLINAVFGALLGFTLASPLAYADDTEVFFGRIDSALQIRPNVLFALDTSGSMGWGQDDPGATEKRITRLKSALVGILEGATNINIGLMRFNGGYGGGPILYPVKYIDEVICEEGDCGAVPILNRISSGNDDAEEKTWNDTVKLNGQTLDLGEHKGGDGDQIIGLRFTGVNVPSGATITSAKLEFQADRYDDGVSELVIGIEDVDNSPQLLAGINNISSRTLATTTENWTPEIWEEDEIYESTDISNVIQQVTNRDGWCGGNAVTVVLSGSGIRDAVSADQDANNAPALKITYDATTIPSDKGCSNKTLVAKVQQKNDDAEQWKYYASTSVYSTDLELPQDYGYQQVIGLRFRNILIPQGATITEASIEFEVDESPSGSVSLDIWGEDTDDAEVYKSQHYNISNRARTGSKVTWANLPALGVNSKMTTPDLTSLVQEVVDRGGWESGNALAFIIERASGTGRRTMESNDGEPSNAPQLTVKYTASGTPNLLTVRDQLIEEVDNLRVAGGTPILDVMYEAAKYYRSEPVQFGKRRGALTPYDYRYPYHRVSHPDSYTGGSVYRHPYCTLSDYENWYCKYEEIQGSPVYQTPMSSSCQSDHIVLLSDGVPNGQLMVNTVKTMTGNSSCEHTGGKACITELAEWLAITDHNSGLSGKQNITTYTIGFGAASGLDFLEAVAEAGDGRYFGAVTSEELQSAFNQILSDVLDIETSFVAPGATVNQFNRLTHRNDIYFSLFKPKESPRWDGNLKKYNLAQTGPDTVRIVDATGTPAVDPSSGFFSPTSKSLWSDEVDGNEVYRGGLAGEIELDHPVYGPRKVYTYTGSGSPVDVELNTAANALHENNGSLTKAMLDITTEDDAYRIKLVKWARGVDVFDENGNNLVDDTRKHIGDPMHSRPLIINYNVGGATVDSTIYIATNEGFLHAVDHESGRELFSFIPQELLPNLDEFYTNFSTSPHPYGLDGSMSTWVDDANENTMVDSGEHAYVYLGMRRGGRNYYAFDVTNRAAPKLKWQIKGGPGGTAGFAELGETWSKPVFAKIKYGSESEKPVLIFGAGYDVNQDDDPALATRPRRPDNTGRGIFIVDAKTGEKLWSASPNIGSGNHQQFTDMQYSIPSDIRVIDIDFDGNADQFYVGDMGGQLWRFDFNQNDPTGNLVFGGVMADLAANEPVHTRRFYYEPDVALISHEGTRYLSIALGSGWRAHPLDDIVQDRFYMIRTEAIYARPAGYGKQIGEGASASWSPIEEDDLLDITNDLAPELDDLLAKQGWLLRLEDSGEKVLGDSITINDQLVFTSYKPDLDVGICDAAAGGGSVYAVNVWDGSPSLGLDEDDSGSNSDTYTKDDRNKDLNHGGIPPEPAALISEEGIPVVLVGPEQPLDEFDFGDLTERTWWQEETTE